MKLKYTSVEQMKYKNDSLSYGLILLGLLANIFYFITLYENNGEFYYTLDMGFSVLYNLIFMLLVFLSAENIKTYNRKYAILTFIIGILQIIRIFVYPARALESSSTGDISLTQYKYNLIVIYLSLSGGLLIIGSIISFIKSTILKQFVDGKLVFDEIER